MKIYFKNICFHFLHITSERSLLYKKKKKIPQACTLWELSDGHLEFLFKDRFQRNCGGEVEHW